MRKLVPVLFAATALVIAFAVPAGAETATNPKMLAIGAAAENPAEAAAAVAALRNMGPAGLDALFDQYSAEIRQHASGGVDADPARWTRISAALDAVGQQRNAYTSHLYWYTDLEQAKAAATAGGRPILSLRLLGNLTDEFSCANSRFFRTALYADPAIAEYLRAHYVLHWSSERAAPRIVIDYGDGRKLERTITGNSIHYILDANGAPLDALPGLYGPGAFLREVILDAGLAQAIAGKGTADRARILTVNHRTRLQAATAEWEADLTAAGIKQPDVVFNLRSKAAPTAVEAAPVAMTKAALEFDMLKSVTADTRRLESLTDVNAWTLIANRHLADAALDDNSLRLMRREMFPRVTGELLAEDQATFAAAVRKFEANIALDTARNEFLLHRQMRAWFLADRGYPAFDELNERIYRELFLTPKSDPWIGLYTPDVYTGLENGGVTQP